MTRLVLRILTFASLLLLLAIPAMGQEQTGEVTIPPLVFPVAGTYNPNFDNFGDCRSGCSRTHEGVDIMAAQMTPVVAVADGTVTVLRGWRDGAPVAGAHQWLIIQHDGWQSRYLHLNNDTEGTNDGAGVGIAPELIQGWVAASGDDGWGDYGTVEAGQVIGWVGNSGNAEQSPHHLHFELRIGTGWSAEPIDPRPILLSSEASTAKAWEGFFMDDDDNVHQSSIDALAERGITRGCNPPANTKYCPEQSMTRGQVAAFIRRTLALPSSDVDHFADDNGSVFDDDINALMAAGIGFGCTDTAFCPDRPLLRDEMARMLVNAFSPADPDRYANPDGTDFFVDDVGNRFEEDINRLMAADVTRGCNPPTNDRYCPDQPLTRAEMASFFVRALYGS